MRNLNFLLALLLMLTSLFGGGASVKAAVSKNFNDAQFYFDKGDYYNAVFYGGEAVKEGYDSKDFQLFMEKASRKLLDQAYQAYHSGNKEHSYELYKFIRLVPGLPKVIYDDAVKNTDWIGKSLGKAPIQEKLVLKQKTYLYNNPGDSKSVGYLAPQTVTVVEKRQDGWYKVSTWLGDKWLKVVYQPQAPKASPVPPSQEKLILKQSTYLYNNPGDKKSVGRLTPQTVNVVEKRQDGWYKVSTWLGAKWLKVGYQPQAPVLTPQAPTINKNLFITKAEFAAGLAQAIGNDYANNKIKIAQNQLKSDDLISREDAAIAIATALNIGFDESEARRYKDLSSMKEPGFVGVVLKFGFMKGAGVNNEYFISAGSITKTHANLIFDRIRKAKRYLNEYQQNINLAIQEGILIDELIGDAVEKTDPNYKNIFTNKLVDLITIFTPIAADEIIATDKMGTTKLGQAIQNKRDAIGGKPTYLTIVTALEQTKRDVEKLGIAVASHFQIKPRLELQEKYLRNAEIAYKKAIEVNNK